MNKTTGKASIIGMFLLANAFVIAFFLIAPNYPLIAIGLLLLIITNFLCYGLVKVRFDRDISQIEANVGDKEVTTSVRLLRYAAAGLAFISFLTTAGGLHEFVFTDQDQLWQAYLASFAVQSILLIFNFLFLQFYVRINSLEKFPKFFKRVLIYASIGLFLGALTISSTFSFVFIANNTYKPMRAKNSNITIERFLNDEIYRLRSVNDAIGEYLRNDLTEEIKNLQEVISTQGSTIESENEAKLQNILKDFDLEKHEKEEGEEGEFYPKAEYEDDKAKDTNDNNDEEYDAIYDSFVKYQNAYNSKYDSAYLPAWNLYQQIKDIRDGDDQDKDDSTKTTALTRTNEAGINTKISTLDEAINNIDEMIVSLGNIRGKNVIYVIKPYIAKATAAFNDLKSNLQSLKTFYETILPVYQAAASSVSANTEDSANIQDILAFMYTSEHSDSPDNETKIDKIQNFLSNQQQMILNESQSDEEQSNEGQSDEEQSNENGIDVEQLNNLEDFQEAFNDYVKYVELRDDIDKFIEDDLNTTYYIKGENETDLPASDDNIKVVSEDHWVKERKQHFSKFISFVKSLPDVDVDGDVENLKELELVSNYYSDSEQVLQSAYTINRDLLEDISGFEKAMNYFKYDFSLMAVFALAMALFLDVASFLTGVFMFGAGFFQCKEKQDQKHDSTKNGA